MYRKPQWFKYMGARLTDRDIQKRLDACSRHRRDVRERPSTPEGFWVPYFPDTQPPKQPSAVDERENAAPEEGAAAVEFRLRNRQQLLEDSMQY